jgi:2-methylcitrate dehydratase PrpD
MPRIKMVVDQNLVVPDDFPASCPTIVSVHLDDGRVIEQSVDRPLGQPGNNIPDGLLQDKFRMCVGPIYGQQRTDQLLKQLIHLQQTQDIRDLTSLITPPAAIERKMYSNL